MAGSSRAGWMPTRFSTHLAGPRSATFASGATAEGYVVEEQPEKDIAMLQVDAIPAGALPAVLGDAGLACKHR